MDRDRFDDVSYRFLEDPDAEPPRPPRRGRRAAIALAAAALGAGALAAGASALTAGDTAAPARDRAPGAHEGWTGYAPVTAAGENRRGECRFKDRDRDQGTRSTGLPRT